MHESEKWKWSPSVVSDPQRPHGLQPTRLLRPWDFPGKSTGVGCHCLLHILSRVNPYSITTGPLIRKGKRIRRTLCKDSRHTGRRYPSDNGCRNWSDGSINQGKPPEVRTETWNSLSHKILLEEPILLASWLLTSSSTTLRECIVILLLHICGTCYHSPKKLVHFTDILLEFDFIWHSVIILHLIVTLAFISGNSWPSAIPKNTYWKIVTNNIRLEKIEYLLEIVIIHKDQSKEDTPALVSAVGWYWVIG